MKNTLKVAPVFFFAFLFLVSIASAQTNTSVDFAAVQARLLKNIETVEAKLDKIEANVQNSNAPQDTKNKALAIIDQIQNELNKLQTEIENAQTMDDLIALRQEVKKYLDEKQAVLREQLKQTVSAIANDVMESVEEIKKAIDVALNTLEITCKEQAQNINKLEQDLVQIQTEVDELKTLVKNQASTSEIKAQIIEISTLAKEIASLSVTVYNECIA